jgi:hypothetical protein
MTTTPAGLLASPRTVSANALVATVNHERMPVLLASEVDHEAWLNGSVEEALALVKPFPPDCMRIAQHLVRAPTQTGYDKRDRFEGAAGVRAGFLAQRERAPVGVSATRNCRRAREGLSNAGITGRRHNQTVCP